MYEIAEGFEVRKEGRALTPLPRFSLVDVRVSPDTDHQAHEKLLSRTFGSVDWLWAGDDEMRFSKETKEIASIAFSAPEVEIGNDWNPHSIMTAERFSGGLLAERVENFALPPMTARWMSDDGKYIVYTNQDEVGMTKKYERIEIARDLDLVFKEGKFCAWILQNPANYIVDEREFPCASPAPSALSSALRDYLTLFVEPKIDAMADGDMRLFRKLGEILQTVIATPDDPRRDILISKIRSFSAEWYGKVPPH